MNKIKQWLLNEELNELEEIAKILKEKEEELARKDRVLQEKQASLKKEKELFNNSKQQEISKVISVYEDEYNRFFNKKKKRIDELLRCKLSPGNKVWVMQFDNQIKEVEVTEVVIRKDDVIIGNNLDFYGEYYSTEKEAIEEYNKRIEKLKK